ncbi:hypothetical protein [Amycolatopsis sp. DSM 110486]|uniref:hypothetical protein n=1 Tax=Amycolatopsis sp. DSM 110486 TaxID=2865832 RepID=UPI001C696A1D|nr:hypothetical protein [Amycolatopsis sp. DSM 110486]QYN22905.1 hypothetical protein K1T34_10815 [Amycolatopsis sp. DSM 110486]
MTVHLRPAEDGDSWFWPNVDLDLTGAKLVDLSLKYCRVRSAVFAGTTTFRYTSFATKADLTGATFAEPPGVEGIELPPGTPMPGGTATLESSRSA